MRRTLTLSQLVREKIMLCPVPIAIAILSSRKRYAEKKDERIYYDFSADCHYDKPAIASSHILVPFDNTTTSMSMKWLDVYINIRMPFNFSSGTILIRCRMKKKRDRDKAWRYRKKSDLRTEPKRKQRKLSTLWNKEHSQRERERDIDIECPKNERDCTAQQSSICDENPYILCA